MIQMIRANLYEYVSNNLYNLNFFKKHVNSTQGIFWNIFCNYSIEEILVSYM